MQILHFRTRICCIPRSAKFALLGMTARRLQEQFIEVRFPLSTPLDDDEPSLFKLLHVTDDAALSDAHIHSQSILAGEAIVVLPRIVQQHGVGELGSRRDSIRLQHEVWHLREPTTSCDVGAANFDVAFDFGDAAADVLHVFYYSVTLASNGGLSPLL